jgi:hypothetical protein
MPLRTTLLAPSEGFKPAGVTTLQWNRRSSRVVRGRRSRRRGSARGSRGRGECRRLGRARRAGRFRGGPSRLAQSIDLHQELGEVADVRLPGSSTRCATGRSFATNSRTSTSPKAQALPPTDRQASKNRQRSRRHAGGARRIRSHGDDAERDYVVRDLTTNVTNTVSTHPINTRNGFGGGFFGDYTDLAVGSDNVFHAFSSCDADQPGGRRRGVGDVLAGLSYSAKKARRGGPSHLAESQSGGASLGRAIHRTAERLKTRMAMIVSAAAKTATTARLRVAIRVVLCMFQMLWSPVLSPSSP